jgi:hypothetical protein
MKKKFFFNKDTGTGMAYEVFVLPVVVDFQVWRAECRL